VKASILDLRRRMRDVLRALERNEPVTILYRGREKARLCPVSGRKDRAVSVAEHAAFGMWKDRADLRQVAQVVRRLRKGRVHAV